MCWLSGVGLVCLHHACSIASCDITMNTWSVKECCLRCAACTQARTYRLKGTTLTSANGVDIETGPHALQIVIKACVPSVQPVHQQWQRPGRWWPQWQQPPEQQWPPFVLPQKPCQPGSWPCQLQPCSSSPHRCSSSPKACWQLPACPSAAASRTGHGIISKRKSGDRP